MEPLLSSLAILAPTRIDDIRPYLDWEVWAPTRGNADAYTWYGLEEHDKDRRAAIESVRQHTHVVQGEWTVQLPDGRSVMLFGILETPVSE